MKHSPYRFLGVIALVMMHLIIAPVTQLLHIGCMHTNDAMLGRSTAADSIAGTTVNWCHASHHDCNQCSARTLARSHQASSPTQNQPVHPPHKDDSCPVCQAAFAARIKTTAPTATTLEELIDETFAGVANSVMLVPRDRVLNRGPPTLCG